ncbi:MAG: glycosyltransferase family A protein [Acidobacteriota bacterium]|nr:glycosyltransferase family A protein [Acidobacteriota bacterium]
MLEPKYALVTAAYNEENYLGRTLDSVVQQTLRPVRWVIVSDASTDRTDEIVLSYQERYPFIQLVRITEDHPRNFAAQVYAIRRGVEALADVEFDFLGNLDADISFAPDYFQQLFARFAANPRLGLSGGVIRELDGSLTVAPEGELLQSVPHAIQMFRRECFEDVGGYPALRFGGPDTYAEVMARMKGWEVQGFADLVVQHYRLTGSAGGVLRGRFRQGRMDYTLGYGALFEFFKCLRRLREKPAVQGAVTRLAGYCWSAVARTPRAVSRKFIEFLRAEQQDRLLSRVRWLPGMRRRAH